MKIRFTTTVKDNRAVFKAGEEHDLPNDKANHFVQSGVARKTPEGSAGFKPGQATRGPVRAPDPASQAAVDAFNGIGAAQTGPLVLSSGNPSAKETTAISGAEVDPLKVAPDPLPSAATDTNPATASPAVEADAQQPQVQPTANPLPTAADAATPKNTRAARAPQANNR